jgi:hypothetical protein
MRHESVVVSESSAMPDAFSSDPASIPLLFSLAKAMRFCRLAIVCFPGNATSLQVESGMMIAHL